MKSDLGRCHRVNMSGILRNGLDITGEDREAGAL